MGENDKRSPPDRVGRQCVDAFRHTMATLMLEGGADVRFIQAMLGHTKLDTTQIYTQVSIRKLKEIHEATHPAKLSREPRTERPEPAGEAGPESIE